MNAREIVLRTLDFEDPDRVSRSFGDSDFVWGFAQGKTCATPWKQGPSGRRERTDEWGNRWARLEDHSKGEVAKGALSSLDDIETLVCPDYSDPHGYNGVKKQRRKHPDKFLLGGLGGFTFNIARKLRKLDVYLMDLMMEPRRIHRLHDMIDAVLLEKIRRYADAGVDGVMFPEDWGTQSQTLISPDIWYEEFFPRFKKLCAGAHERGLRVFMHSCGAIGAIVPGLIEAGIDVLQFDQPDLHGIDTLAGYQRKSKITFWCPVDIQKTLQTKNEKTIREKAREMVDKLWQGRGGFIAGCYPDNTSIGLDPEWQEIACDEFLRRGVTLRLSGSRP